MENLNETFFLELAFACSEIRQSFDDITSTSQARRQLLALLKQNGELRHADLQRELSLDGATVTRLVKEFEGGGFVSRRLDPQNNRFTLVALTESGRKKIAGLQAAHHSFEVEILANISPEEQAAVVSVLQRLRENIRQSEANKLVDKVEQAAVVSVLQRMQGNHRLSAVNKLAVEGEKD